jgi:hypothetical protein
MLPKSGPIKRKLLFGVEPYDVAQIQTYWGVASACDWGLEPRQLDPEIGKAQLASEQAAIRVRVGPPGGGFRPAMRTVETAAHSLGITPDRRIDLRVSPFEIGVGHQGPPWPELQI